MPFNPFAGQPADTHRGRPRKEPPKTKSEPDAPLTDDASSWEAAWGDPAVPDEPEEPPFDGSDGFIPAFAGRPEKEPSEPDDGVVQASSEFAAAFAGQVGRAPEGTREPPANGDDGREADASTSDGFAAAFAERPEESLEPEGDDAPVPPEFAAAFDVGGAEGGDETGPEDPAERARLERIGMETADPEVSDGGFGDWRSMIGAMSDDEPAERSGGWTTDGPEESDGDSPVERTESAPAEAQDVRDGTSDGWGGASGADGWPTEANGTPSTDEWPSGPDDMDGPEEPEPFRSAGGILKLLAVIGACVLALVMLGGGAFLAVRFVASNRASDARDASCAVYSRWVGEYRRAASDAKRLSVKAASVDAHCPASDTDKAAEKVKTKAKSLSAQVAKAAAREWETDRKTLSGLKGAYPSASADTLSEAKELAGEAAPADLADLNDMRSRAGKLVAKAKKEQSDADAKAEADKEAKEKADAEAKAKQEAEQEAARRQAEAEEAARQQAAQQQQQNQQYAYTPQRRQTYTPQRRSTTPAPTPTPTQPSAPSGNASQDF